MMLSPYGVRAEDICANSSTDAALRTAETYRRTLGRRVGQPVLFEKVGQPPASALAQPRWYPRNPMRKRNRSSYSQHP